MVIQLLAVTMSNMQGVFGYGYRGELLKGRERWVGEGRWKDFKGKRTFEQGNVGRDLDGISRMNGGQV